MIGVTERRRNAPSLGAIAATMCVLVAVAGCSSPGSPSTAGSTPSSTAPVSEPAMTHGSGEARATLVLTGDLDESYNFTEQSGNISPTSELIAAVWVDPDINTLTLTGDVIAGTSPTSARLILGWVIGPDSTTFASADGECQVTMEPTATALSGSFTCTGLSSADGALTVDATGTFSS
jgi:hypothetical protein